MPTENQMEARRLKVIGVPIIAMDGREFRIIYDMDGIAQLEEDFGSLGAMQDTLNEMMRDQESAKFVKPMTKMIRAGLMHDETARGVMLDMEDFGHNMRQVLTAMRLYFPKGPKGSSQPDQTTPTTTGSSPGIPSTTQQPSSSVAAMSSSGE